jgi:phosphoserine phosphatase
MFVRAMGGQVLFEDALAARLDIIRPSRSDITDFLIKNPLELTKGVKELIGRCITTRQLFFDSNVLFSSDYFHSKGVFVYLISGGFRQVPQTDTHRD